MFNEKVYFENVNGKKVFCVLSEPKPCQKKIVIMSHGFRGSSLGPARSFVDFSKILNKEGFSTLRFDQPSGGNSEGDYVNSSFNEWVQTIVVFASKYIEKGYKIALFGQSMGASATVIATNNAQLKNKIPVIIIWVPDPKSTTFVDTKKTYEEGGQKYKGKFWTEARESNFFECLKKYEGKIHLVYGEKDCYISKRLRDRVINKTKEMGHTVVVLKGQDHSPWTYDLRQKVYKEELDFLKRFI